jgi:hypothetical protein
MNKAINRKLDAVYEEDDQNFSNIMGGPHWNITDRGTGEVCATVWIEDDPAEDPRGPAEEDALLFSAAPNLYRAARRVLDWAGGQDEDYLPKCFSALAAAIKKAEQGDKNTVFE